MTDNDVGPVEVSRRGLLRRVGVGGTVVGGTFLASGLKAMPVPGGVGLAAADQPLDGRMLQTAGSLEILLIKAYDLILTLPFMGKDNPYLAQFAQNTRAQHDQHRQAFAEATAAVRAKPQLAPNQRYARVLEDAKPALNGPADIVKLAAMLEEAATETYLANLTTISDAKSKSIMAKIVGVEAEHLAILRVMGYLFDQGLGGLVKAPLGPDVAKVPPEVASVAFPNALEGTDHASPPDEGAVP